MGFFSDDISNALLLVSIALIFPTVICMRWHPGWWVVCVGTLSLLLNVVLAADGGFEAFNIDGTGRKTAWRISGRGTRLDGLYGGGVGGVGALRAAAREALAGLF